MLYSAPMTHSGESENSALDYRILQEIEERLTEEHMASAAYSDPACDDLHQTIPRIYTAYGGRYSCRRRRDGGSTIGQAG
jgi:hypothetical protein